MRSTAYAVAAKAAAQQGWQQSKEAAAGLHPALDRRLYPKFMLSSVAARAGGRVLLSCSAQARRRSVRALSATSSGPGAPRGGSVSMSYRSVEYEVHGIGERRSHQPLLLPPGLSRMLGNPTPCLQPLPCSPGSVLPRAHCGPGQISRPSRLRYEHRAGALCCAFASITVGLDLSLAVAGACGMLQGQHGSRLDAVLPCCTAFLLLREHAACCTGNMEADWLLCYLEYLACPATHLGSELPSCHTAALLACRAL